MIGFVLLTLAIIKYALTNNENTANKHAAIVLRTLYKEFFICYDRNELPDNDSKWLSKLNINEGYIKYPDWDNKKTMDKIIAKCHWEHFEQHEFVIKFVYAVSYSPTESELTDIIKRDGNIWFLIGNINEIHYEQIIINKKTNALIEFLNYRYNFVTSHLEEKSFIQLSEEGLKVVLFENNNASWMSKEFTIRNTQYSALVNNFDCLSPKSIKKALFRKLYQDNLISKKFPETKLECPCILDESETVWVASPLDDKVCVTSEPPLDLIITFVGRYDFDRCNDIITGIIANADLCRGNEHCNLSSLDSKPLLKNIDQVEIYNNVVSFDAQKNCDLINTLKKDMQDHCILEFLLSPYNKNVDIIICLTLHFLYAILNHEYFVNENVNVAIIAIDGFQPVNSKSYLFLDPYYGLILSQEEIIHTEKIYYHKYRLSMVNSYVLTPVAYESITQSAFSSISSSIMSFTSSKISMADTTSSIAAVHVSSSFITSYRAKKANINIPIKRLPSSKIAIAIVTSLTALSIIFWVLILKYVIFRPHDLVEDL